MYCIGTYGPPCSNETKFENYNKSRVAKWRQSKTWEETTSGQKNAFPLRNTSFSKLAAVRDDFSGLIMSNPKLKSRSNATDDGRGVLFISLEQLHPGVTVGHGEKLGRHRGGAVPHPDIVPTVVSLLKVFLETARSDCRWRNCYLITKIR